MFWNRKGKEVENLIEDNQQQAVAAWINYLNDVRLTQLNEGLQKQTINHLNATKELNEAFNTMQKEIILKNRGGNTGMHGFIAEISETGFENADRLIQGYKKNCEWINNNSVADLQRGTIGIQQKFVASKGLCSMNAVVEHLDKYPDYIKAGNRYQIPKDHYEMLQKYMNMSYEEASKHPTTDDFSLAKWNKLHNIFETNEISMEDIEPSQLRYSESQRGAIDQTYTNKKLSIKEKNQKIKEKIYDKSKPTMSEGAKATAVSAVLEGTTVLAIEIRKKVKQGKSISRFTKEDWVEISKKSGFGYLKGAIRGSSVYALTNFTATPAATANAIVTASFGVAEQAYLLRQGELTEGQFLLNSEIICVDVSVSALSSLIGQTVIPIPVLGAIIGNTVGTMMYNVAKDNLSANEQRIIQGYLDEIVENEKNLDKKYQKFVKEMYANVAEYIKILDMAFSPDVELAFVGSIQLAYHVGLDYTEILKTLGEVDEYFLTDRRK